MVDRYTKAVLTVIASALTVLAIQGTIPSSQAYTGDIQKVQICDRRNCADLYLRWSHFVGQFGREIKVYSGA